MCQNIFKLFLLIFFDRYICLIALYLFLFSFFNPQTWLFSFIYLLVSKNTEFYESLRMVVYIICQREVQCNLDISSKEPVNLTSNFVLFPYQLSLYHNYYWCFLWLFPSSFLVLYSVDKRTKKQRVNREESRRNRMGK